MLGVSELKELFELLPNSKRVDVWVEKDFSPETLLKFKALEEINFINLKVEFLEIINYFELLGNNNLKKVGCSYMEGKNTMKFYDILFQKTNLKEFSRVNMKKEQFPDFISWLNKSNVEILHLYRNAVSFIL
jgi:hypothetical protein